MKKPRTVTPPAIAPLSPTDLTQVTGGDGTTTTPPHDSVSGNSTGRRQYKPVDWTA